MPGGYIRLVLSYFLLKHWILFFWKKCEPQVHFMPSLHEMSIFASGSLACMEGRKFMHFLGAFISLCSRELDVSFQTAFGENVEMHFPTFVSSDTTMTLQPGQIVYEELVANRVR